MHPLLIRGAYVVASAVITEIAVRATHSNPTERAMVKRSLAVRFPNQASHLQGAVSKLFDKLLGS